MELTINETTYEITVSDATAQSVEAVDPKELADLIAASGYLDAATGAGMDPTDAINAALGTPDAFEALLDGRGDDAFSAVLDRRGAETEALLNGFGVPTAEPDFGDLGIGDLADAGDTEGHLINSVGQAMDGPGATGNGDTSSGTTSVDDIPRHPDRAGGTPVYDDNGKVVGVWSNGSIKIDVEAVYDKDGNIKGYVDWNGEYRSKEEMEKNDGWDPAPEDTDGDTSGGDTSGDSTEGEGTTGDGETGQDDSDGGNGNQPEGESGDTSTTPVDNGGETDGTTPPTTTGEDGCEDPDAETGGTVLPDEEDGLGDPGGCEGEDSFVFMEVTVDPSDDLDPLILTDPDHVHVTELPPEDALAPLVNPGSPDEGVYVEDTFFI